jgi:hypothetical protein
VIQSIDSAVLIDGANDGLGDWQGGCHDLPQLLHFGANWA